MNVDRKVAYTEYAVEVNNDNKFVRQVEVFSCYEDAEKFADNYDGHLNDDEYLNIIFIDYDEYDDEIEFGTVC